MTEREQAFDVAVKNRRNFDYRGRVDLTTHDIREELVAIQQAFNAALAVEGQNITDHAPHPLFHFDYLDSDLHNALAFTDGAYSFIGVTLPLVGNVSRVSDALSASDAVVSGLDLPLTNERELIHSALFWMMLNFVVTHEYSHHVRGHIQGALEPDLMDEIRGGSLNGSIQRQAREADADGYSAYFSLTFWFDNPEGRRLAVQLLQLEDVSTERQEEILFSCFLTAVAGFTFLREPESLDTDTAYRRTHPPQSLRLRMVTGFIRKWASDFRPTLFSWMTNDRFRVLMDAVSAVVWTTSGYAAGWSAQAAFLRSPEGAAYVDTVYAELNRLRGT